MIESLIMFNPDRPLETWGWVIRADFDTTGFPESLSGVAYSPEIAAEDVTNTVFSLNSWYWDRQQLVLDFGSI